MTEEYAHRLKTPELSPPPIPLPQNKAVESTPEPEAKKTGESTDRPHSASYFNVPEWGELLLNPSADIYGLKDKIVYIESTLSDKMIKSGMKRDSESYSKLLGEIEAYLQLDKTMHEPVYRVGRVYNMLRTIERARVESEERKRYLESILNKD